MKPTLWINVLTGQPLDRLELSDLRFRARAVYAANTHIFEDEAEALSALGVVPLLQLTDRQGAYA